MIYFENRRYAQKNPTTKIKRDRNQNIGERSEIKKPTGFCPCGFAEMLFRPESLEEFASQSGFSMDGRPSSYERSNVQSRSDVSWKMTLLYGVDRGDTSLPKVRFCICHPLQSSSLRDLRLRSRVCRPRLCLRDLAKVPARCPKDRRTRVPLCEHRGSRKGSHGRG
jgi:hypothetical protein